MFLHIGDDFCIPKRDIVAILDADTATRSRATRTLWQKKQEEGLVIDCSGELPLSLILVQGAGRDTFLYLSRLSAKTLSFRAKRRKGRYHLD